jgi:hypothetical protein
MNDRYVLGVILLSKTPLDAEGLEGESSDILRLVLDCYSNSSRCT